MSTANPRSYPRPVRRSTLPPELDRLARRGLLPRASIATPLTSWGMNNAEAAALVASAGSPTAPAAPTASPSRTRPTPSVAEINLAITRARASKVRALAVRVHGKGRSARNVQESPTVRPTSGPAAPARPLHHRRL